MGGGGQGGNKKRTKNDIFYKIYHVENERLPRPQDMIATYTTESVREEEHHNCGISFLLKPLRRVSQSISREGPPVQSQNRCSLGLNI